MYVVKEPVYHITKIENKLQVYRNARILCYQDKGYQEKNMITYDAIRILDILSGSSATLIMYKITGLT